MCTFISWDSDVSYCCYPLYNMWGCMFSIYPFLLWWLREYIYFVLLSSYYHHQIGSMNYYPLFRVRSWNNGLRCMSFHFFVVNYLHSLFNWAGNTCLPTSYKMPVRLYFVHQLGLHMLHKLHITLYTNDSNHGINWILKCNGVNLIGSYCFRCWVWL